MGGVKFSPERLVQEFSEKAESGDMKVLQILALAYALSKNSEVEVRETGVVPPDSPEHGGFRVITVIRKNEIEGTNFHVL